MPSKRQLFAGQASKTIPLTLLMKSNIWNKSFIFNKIQCWWNIDLCVHSTWTLVLVPLAGHLSMSAMPTMTSQNLLDGWDTNFHPALRWTTVGDQKSEDNNGWIFNLWTCVMVVWRSRAGHWLALSLMCSRGD